MKLIDADILLNSFKGAKKLGVDAIKFYVDNAPTIDLVMCKECKYYNGHQEYCDIDYFARENGFCSSGKRRIDYTVFTVNPPKGVETPLNGDATVFHKNSKITQMKGENDMDCEKKMFAWPANLTNGLDEICHACTVCEPTINGYYLDYLGKYVLECEHREACNELNRRLVEKYESK